MFYKKKQKPKPKAKKTATKYAKKILIDNDENDRCRNVLKPYVGQKLSFFGYLKEVNNNRVKINEKKSKNILLIDVHVVKFDFLHDIKNIMNNVEKHKKENIQLNHVHCQTTLETNLNNDKDKFVAFNGKVIEYTTTYNGKNETRYGIDDFELKSSLTKQYSKDLNNKFRYKLTKYQKDTMSKIFNITTKRYNKDSFKTKQQMIIHYENINNIQGRTQQLSSVLEYLATNPNYSIKDKKLNPFLIRKNSYKDKFLSSNDITEVRYELSKSFTENNRLNTEIKKLTKEKNELKKQLNSSTRSKEENSFRQMIFELKQDKIKLKKELNILKNKDNSFIDLLKSYFIIKKQKLNNKKENKAKIREKENKPSDEQLNMLQEKFNNK